MSSHSCNAMVVCCIDFRFQKYIRDFTDKNLAGKTFDLVGFAGATKELDIVMKQIEISINLHHITQIILIHHEECGAYGAESTPQRHAADLHKARDLICSQFPGIQVDLYYLHLDGTFEKIEAPTDIRAFPQTHAFAGSRS